MNIKGVPGKCESYAAFVAAGRFGCSVDEFKKIKSGEIVAMPDAIADLLVGEGLAVVVPAAPAGEGEE